MEFESLDRDQSLDKVEEDDSRELAVGAQEGEGADTEPEEEETEPEGEAGDQNEEPEEEQKGGEAEEKKPPQTREENAVARAARLQAERETEARVTKRLDTEIASMGMTNPYTGKPLRSLADLKAYGDTYRKERLAGESKRTGKSVAELEEEERDRLYAASLREERLAKEAAARQREERRRFMVADLTDFTARFPGVDPAALEQDARFKAFAGSRLYREPLGDLYESFKSLLGTAQQAAAAKAASKRERGTGSGAGGGGATLSPAQQRELDAWNRENPDMKMTVKEFLGY